MTFIPIPTVRVVLIQASINNLRTFSRTRRLLVIQTTIANMMTVRRSMNLPRAVCTCDCNLFRSAVVVENKDVVFLFVEPPRALMAPLVSSLLVLACFLIIFSSVGLSPRTLPALLLFARPWTLCLRGVGRVLIDGESSRFWRSRSACSSFSHSASFRASNS